MDGARTGGEHEQRHQWPPGDNVVEAVMVDEQSIAPQPRDARDHDGIGEAQAALSCEITGPGGEPIDDKRAQRAQCLDEPGSVKQRRTGSRARSHIDDV